jgi:excisionase family DNA binding protein
LRGGILTPAGRLVNFGCAHRPYSSASPAPILLSKRRDIFRTRPMMIERKTISIMKACELVGVSRRTIYNWIASGKIEYVRTAGGSVRIFVDTLWREPGRNAALASKEAS